MAGLVRTHDLTDPSQHGWALAAIADHGLTAALESAERADSPASRGAVMISIWFDPADDGRLRERVSYERSAQ